MTPRLDDMLAILGVEIADQASPPPGPGGKAGGDTHASPATFDCVLCDEPSDIKWRHPVHTAYCVDCAPCERCGRERCGETCEECRCCSRFIDRNMMVRMYGTVVDECSRHGRRYVEGRVCEACHAHGTIEDGAADAAYDRWRDE